MDILKNDDGAVNLDLIFALAIFVGTAFIAYQIMPSMSHEDRDWRIKQYTTAARASDNLVHDAGYAGWETNWSNHDYSNVTKIGLVYVGNNGEENQILNKAKIDILMYNYTDNNTNLVWWEFPNTSMPITDDKITNATRALGLEGYNFYMQLSPAGIANLNYTIIQTNISNLKRINFNTASMIDRYVYIKDNGEYLKYNGNVTIYNLNIWVWQ